MRNLYIKHNIRSNVKSFSCEHYHLGRLMTGHFYSVLYVRSGEGRYKLGYEHFDPKTLTTVITSKSFLYVRSVINNSLAT